MTPASAAAQDTPDQGLRIPGRAASRARTHAPADIDLTLCLLSPDPAALRRRILARGWGQGDGDEAAAENAVLQRPFIDMRIETTTVDSADGCAAAPRRTRQ